MTSAAPLRPFDPRDPLLRNAPYPLFAQYREQDPVHWSEAADAYVLTRHRDISAVLSALDAKLGGAQIVRISCALLIRVDFIAAGDLLNWITARQGEGRHISFIDVHRLVALMFGAMGITEHAPVHLRQA